ncbi:MAG: TetR/AcrR family transcriptional regulator [Actinobacteria bacterium]|nr:TetR/AcrR family transcriptional regulator [Actinomycetota bacterium]
MPSAPTSTGFLGLIRPPEEPDTTADAAASTPERDAALDGARAAFLDFGIRRTTMNVISRRSGVSPATLYRWYGSKDGIVAAVALREIRRFLAEIDAHADAMAPPEEQLAEVTVMVARGLREQPLLQRLIETEPDDILPRLTTHGWPIIAAGAEYLTGHIQRLIDEGHIAQFDPAPLAEILARVTHSLLLTPQTSLRLGDDETIRFEAREAFRWLLRSVEGTPS